MRLLSGGDFVAPAKDGALELGATIDDGQAPIGLVPWGERPPQLDRRRSPRGT